MVSIVMEAYSKLLCMCDKQIMLTLTNELLDYPKQVCLQIDACHTFTRFIYSQREIGWSTFKRPGLDDFLVQMSRFYEIIVYTDDLHMDHRLQEKLAQRGVTCMLTRPQTKYQDGKHYRDLSKINRDPSKILYVSGHALETCLQHENCIPIKPWRKEAYDTTLMDLIPFLEYVGLQRPVDIRPVLASFHGKDIPSEFIRLSEEYQRTLLEKQQRGPIWRRNMVRPSSGHVG